MAVVYHIKDLKELALVFQSRAMAARHSGNGQTPGNMADRLAHLESVTWEAAANIVLRTVFTPDMTEKDIFTLTAEDRRTG